MRIAAGSARVTEARKRCGMGIEGKWFNELGSLMTIAPIDGNVLSGEYQTRVGDPRALYTLSGQTDGDGNKHGWKSDAQAVAAAEDDAAEQIPSLKIGAEWMGPARRRQYDAGLLVGAIGGDIGREDRHQDQARGDQQPGQRRRIPRHMAQKACAGGSRGRRIKGGRAHVTTRR